jgi:hypothetical protein
MNKWIGKILNGATVDPLSVKLLDVYNNKIRFVKSEEGDTDSYSSTGFLPSDKITKLCIRVM